MSLTARSNVSVRFYRKTTTATSYPPTTTWAEISGSPVLCVKNRLSVGERVARDGKIIDVSEVLYMRPFVITESDRARIGDVMYDICGIKNPNSRDKHMKVELTEIPDAPPPDPEPEGD